MVGLAYPRCVAPLESVFEQLATSKAFVSACGVVGTHHDGTPRIHEPLQKKLTAVSIKRFCEKYEGVTYRRNVRHLSTKLHQHRWHHYLAKEGQPVEYGKYTMQHDNTSAADHVNFAKSEGIDLGFAGLCGDRWSTGEGSEH